MIRDKRQRTRFRPRLKRYLSVGTTALVGITILLFQNCQPNYLLKVALLAAQSENSAAQTVETPLASPFADGKLQVSWRQLLADEDFRVRNQSAFSRASDSIFSFGQNLPLGLQDPLPSEQDLIVDEDRATFLAGQEMVVLIDNHCRRQQQGTSTFSTALESQLAGIERPALSVEAYAYEFSDSQSVSQFRDWLESDPCIIGASENQVASITAESLNNDSRFNELTHLRAINFVNAQDLFNLSSLKVTQDVVIAIGDTGVAHDHPDLQNVMWRDGTGHFGHDYINNDDNPMDDHGHGSHCAGLAAAQNNNGIGVSGVMGFHARIMGVKVLAANGSGYTNQIVNGINYAADNNADVLNLSLGGAGQNASYQDAMARAVAAGTFVAVAAGNDNTQITTSSFFSPAGYAKDIRGALSVGSYDAMNYAKSSFSNYSTTYVEIGAPGSSGTTRLLSTVPGGGYSFMHGTSMASPVLAGAAALTIGILRTNGISYTPADIEDILFNGSPSRSGLSTYFKDGKALDLEKVGEYIQRVYLFGQTGGFN